MKASVLEAERSGFWKFLDTKYLQHPQTHPEHGLSEGLLLAGVLSEPVQHQLAEIREVDETIFADVVGNINYGLLGGIQSQAFHSHGQILSRNNNESLFKIWFSLQRDV